jgi:hypothetical protein
MEIIIKKNYSAMVSESLGKAGRLHIFLLARNGVAG